MRGFDIEPSGFAISPNGKMIAIGDANCQTTKCLAKVFDLATGKTLLKLPYRSRVSARKLVFTPDNSKLITAVYERIYVWDLPKRLLKK